MATRILVTGGAGFIRSALVRYLVRDVGTEVSNIDRLTYAGNVASLKVVENGRTIILNVNICDTQLM